MKQNPEYERIQANMVAGKISSSGFLGEDQRTLQDILHEDNLTVLKTGYSHEAIAQRMGYLTEQGKKGMGSPVIVDDIFEVTADDHRGFIPCPFGDNFKAPKTNVMVKNLITSDTIHWTELNIHMIEKHGFYEGKGSFFRIDPEELVKIIFGKYID